MTIPLRLGHRAEYLLPVVEYPKSEGGLELSTAELAFRIFAAFRAHPHINNVLTHISRASGSRWSNLSTAFLICRRPLMVFRHLRRTSST